MFLRNQPKNIHVKQIKVNAINEIWMDGAAD